MRRLLILFLFFAVTITHLHARYGADSVTAAGDSLVSPFVKKVWEASARDKQKSQATYEAGKTAIKQRAVWEALTETAQDVKLYLDNGVNAGSITVELQSIRKSFTVVQDGIFTNKGTAQTERNLSVSSAILFQLIEETSDRKKQVDHYVNDLIRYRNRIDSLLSDPVIYVFPNDSALLVKYLSRVRVIVRQGNPSDNALNATLESVQALQNDVDYLLYSLKSSYEKTEAYRSNLSNINLKREFADIWESVGYSRSFPEILHFSFVKEQMALQFYIREHLFKLFLLAGFTLLIYFTIYSVKNKLKEEALLNEELQEKLVIRHPVAASLVITFSVYQFVFINAPFIFSFCMWVVGIIALFVLLKGFITHFWLRFWITLSGLFLLACMDNFILQASRTERWIMAGLSFCGAAYSVYIIFTRRREELKEKKILYFIRFLLVLEVLSFVLNLFGRYNLSKILLAAGYIGVVNAILFIWVVQLINELLAMAGAVYKHPERKLLYINFNRVGNKAPVFLYVLLMIGWVVIVGRNFYAFKKIAVPLQAFLLRERTLGDYSFSINGLFLFLLIAASAMVLSRIVSLFAADPQAIHGNTARGSKKIAIGSWILLIRIFIISLGLFLAFAAAGLPLDKITIVLGALSVGIGLGLQGLVSNLISGLIIAFEKPVNVGDFIEVNGKSGTMRSIGFRSSIVALTDGSSLVVPNGDLLNNHVINWSMTRDAKRLVIALGVAYGSDLARVKEVLEQTVNEDERVLKMPAAVAVPKRFGDNAISFDLIFWVKSQREAISIMGNTIMAIDIALKEAGIAIPFPRQDIHLYTEGGEEQTKTDDTRETEKP